MSTTPVPVPSKAAIRVLRGLVFGTTCSIVLVTEDRRRRINAAKTAIANGQKIKSLRNYHAGAAAAAIRAKEEEAFIAESWPFPRRHPENRLDRLSPGRANGEDSVQPMLRIVNGELRETLPPSPPAPESLSSRAESCAAGEAKTGRANRVNRTGSISTVQPKKHGLTGDGDVNTTSIPAAPTLLHPRPDPIPSPTPAPTLPALIRQPQNKSFGHARPPRPTGPKSLDRDFAKFAEFCAKDRNPTHLREGILQLLSILYRPKETLEPYRDRLLEYSALLCRGYQRSGDMENARLVLQTVVDRMEPDEGAYFAHEPLSIILHVLQADKRDKDLQLSIALGLFLPQAGTTKRPNHERAKDVMALAEPLIRVALNRPNPRLVVGFMDRVLPYLHGSEGISFLQRMLVEMDAHYMPKTLLRFFFRYDTDAMKTLSVTKYRDIGDLAVKSVSATHGVQAGEVLDRLRAILPETWILKTGWVCELLYQHWQAHKSFTDTAALFERTMGARRSNTGGLREKRIVEFADGPYRAMIQVALEAGEENAASRYFADLVAQEPRATQDVRILGLFALARARAGDWDGMHAVFQEGAAPDRFKDAPACSTTMLSSPEGAQIFVPILKVFSKSHTVTETEEFLKAYLDNFGLPLSKYMVTLMASRYGEVRDLESFLAWLDYCAGHASRGGGANSGSGKELELDAAFTNALLKSCRDHWKLPFLSLRAVYRRLHVLSADLTDEATEHIMAGAALASPVSKRRVKAGLVNSVRTKPGGFGPAAATRRMRRQDPLDQNDVYESMALSLNAARPLAAISTYRRATAAGMRDCPRCLRLFSTAHVQLGEGGGPDLDEPLHVLRRAQEQGVNVDAALTPLLIAQLEQHVEPSSWDQQGQGQDQDYHAGEQPRATSGRGFGFDDRLLVVLRRMRSCGFRVTSGAFMKAAAVYAAQRDHRGAVALALKAAEAKGDPPGYSAANFSVLMEAYLALGRVDEVDALVRAATESGHWEGMAGRDRNLLKSLKYWRRQLVDGRMMPRATPREARRRALELVEMVLRRVGGSRRRLFQEDQPVLTAEALDIIEAAFVKRHAENKGRTVTASRLGKSQGMDIGSPVATADSVSSTVTGAAAATATTTTTVPPVRVLSRGASCGRGGGGEEADGHHQLHVVAPSLVAAAGAA